MSLPSKINICGIPYRVIVCPDHFNSAVVNFGEIDYKAGEIRIAEAPEDLQLQTLIHEFLHGALFMLGQDEYRSNEQLVQGLAMAIHQTFRPREEA